MTVVLEIISISFTLISPAMTNMVGRIGGGEYTNISRFPHAVYLKSDATFLSTCGASILTESIILTAANCFYYIKTPYNMTASMGNDGEGLGQVRIVRDYIMHEQLTEHNLANDIALAWLDRPVEFGTNVKKVALMRTPPYYEPAFMAGWGKLKDSGEDSIFLKYTIQHLADKQECLRFTGPERIAEGTICMENRLRNSRANMGDTGNALVVRGFIQVGLVSWGDIDKSYSMMIFTNTSYHYDWIMTKAKELYCRNQEP